jgi:hypothetical protein
MLLRGFSEPGSDLRSAGLHYVVLDHLEERHPQVQVGREAGIL